MLRWVLSIMVLCNVDAAEAAAGALQGVVLDAVTGEVLPGALVQLEGTRLGTVSDRAGRFYLAGVESGAYEVHISYVGYESYRGKVTVKADRTAMLEAGLHSGFVELNGLVVEGQREGQARALNR